MQSYQRDNQLATEPGSSENAGVLPIGLLSEIGQARSLAQIDDLARRLWAMWGEGRLGLNDSQAQTLAEILEARRKTIRGLDRVAVRAPEVAAQARLSGLASHFPAKRRPPASPNRRASIERRRLLAASGPMPPALASRFTTGELAALRIVADEVRDSRDCRLTVGAIAARAGVSVTTARRALRYAARCGLVLIEERRRHLQPNLPNIVRIVSSEWISWINRGQKIRAKQAYSRKSSKDAASHKGGRQKRESTDNKYFKTKKCDRSLSNQHHPHKQERPRNSGRSGKI